MSKRNSGRPEDHFGCFGYFGFGGGWVMGSESKEWMKGGGAMYCNRCPTGDRCWNRHRQRVREIAPVAAEEFEQCLEELESGPSAVQAFYAKHGIADPYTIVMGGNLEDGLAVGLGSKPKDRGRSTLQFPLKPLLET